MCHIAQPAWPDEAALLCRAGRVRTAKLLLDTLLDTGLAERKLVLWAFSNGGTFVCAQLTRMPAQAWCTGA